MISPLESPRETGPRFQVSPARMGAVAFIVLVLTMAYTSYVDYCVLARIYVATSEVQITQPVDPESPNPMRGEIELMSSPDVLAPIVTDLQLDKIWAGRFRSALDALPMLDSLAYLHHNLRLQQVPGTDIITVSVASDVPKEASDIANAIPNRYETVREMGIHQLFEEKEQALNGAIAEQTKVVAQKSGAVAALRAQLQAQGLHLEPGAAGLIVADYAAQKTGSMPRIDVLAPLRAAQAELDTEQKALDDMQLEWRKIKTDLRLTPNPVQIISLADPPEYPTLPNHTADLLVGLGEGIGMALVAATLLELALWYLSRFRPVPLAEPLFPATATPASSNY